MWIGGLRWEKLRWHLRPEGVAWWGAVELDLEHLPVGQHRVVVEAAGHPPLDLTLERLSEI